MTVDAEEYEKELQMQARLRCSHQLPSPIATLEHKTTRLGELVI